MFECRCEQPPRCSHELTIRLHLTGEEEYRGVGLDGLRTLRPCDRGEAFPERGDGFGAGP